MTERIRTRWAHGPDFAEVAEALGVRTDQVMAMLPRDGIVTVMFTPKDHGRIWAASLERDRGGILQAVNVHETDLTFEDITRMMGGE